MHNLFPIEEEWTAVNIIQGLIDEQSVLNDGKFPSDLALRSKKCLQFSSISIFLLNW